jgi:hypothetical protein
MPSCGARQPSWTFEVLLDVQTLTVRSGRTILNDLGQLNRQYFCLQRQHANGIRNGAQRDCSGVALVERHQQTNDGLFRAYRSNSIQRPPRQ